MDSTGIAVDKWEFMIKNGGKKKYIIDKSTHLYLLSTHLTLVFS